MPFTDDLNIHASGIRRYVELHISNISEEFAAFIFRAVETLFLEYHEDGKKLFRNNGTYTRRRQFSSQHTFLWLSPGEVATSNWYFSWTHSPACR